MGYGGVMADAVRVRLDGELVDTVARMVRSTEGEQRSLPACVEMALRGWVLERVPKEEDADAES